MTLAAWWSLSIQEIKKIFAYRMNFWLQFIGSSGGEIAIAYLLWGAIFTDTGNTEMGGLTLPMMIRYYVFAALFSRIVRGAENFQVSQEIYDGSLTRFLIYPGNYFAYKLSERFSFLIMTIFQAFVGLGIYMLIFRGELSGMFTPEGLTMAFVMAIYSAFFNFMLMTIVELSAFWADNAWSLSVMMRFITGFFSGMMLPLSLYPEWLQTLLHYSPFPSMMYIPVQLALGNAGFPQFVEACVNLTFWTVPLCFGMAVVWKRGVKQYTGVGQ